MKKPRIKNALTGLDIIHADLWLKREKLRDTTTKSLIVNETEIQSLILLVQSVMKELGFEKEFSK